MILSKIKSYALAAFGIIIALVTFGAINRARGRREGAARAVHDKDQERVSKLSKEELHDEITKFDQ